MDPSDCMVLQTPVRKRLYMSNRFIHSEKAKMPMRPNDDTMMWFELNNISVRQMEAIASGAPWETSSFSIENIFLMSLLKMSRRLFLAEKKWNNIMAIPTT